MGAQRSLPEAVGQLLSGTYQIERKIAEGGMGVVYEASHVRLPRRFAIKLLGRPADGADSDVVLERFKREAQVASALKNPHVVQIYDYQIAEGGFPYIVMELLEGEDLARRIKTAGRVPPAAVVRIIAQIADALDAAHAIGIIHRDLKPANVFLNVYPEPDFVKVLDFGVSKMIDLATITRTDALVGTPLYMSPEQAGGGHDITHVSDLFGLGAIAYELLTGLRPFTGKSIPAILYQVVHAEPTSVSSLLGSAARDVDAVFAQALAKDPDLRYRSAGELARALRAGLRALLEPEAPAAAPVPTETSNQHTVVRLEGNRGPQAPLAELVEESLPSISSTPTRLSGPGVGPRANEPRAAEMQPIVDRGTEPTRSTFANAPWPQIASAGQSVAPRGELQPIAQPPRRAWQLRGGALLLSAGVVVVLVSAITIGVRRGHSPTPSVTSLVTHAADDQPARGSAPPSEVHIAVRTTPSYARVFLDDTLVQGGQITVPWRSEPRDLRVSAAGYQPSVRAVDATLDRAIEVNLVPEAGTIAPSTPARSRPGPRTERGGRPARTRPAPRPVSSAPHPSTGGNDAKPSHPTRTNSKLVAPVQDL